MKRSILLLSASLLALVVVAQEPRAAVQYAAVSAAPVLGFTPKSCLRANEMPVMQLDVRAEGALRAYFRRVGAIDWCSVDGQNERQLSRVTLPRFEAGEEIEYYFVLLNGQQIVARSPEVYRAAVNSECETLSARHNATLFLACGQGGATSPAAGQILKQSLVDGLPPQGSPDSPTFSATNQ